MCPGPKPLGCSNTTRVIRLVLFSSHVGSFIILKPLTPSLFFDPYNHSLTTSLVLLIHIFPWPFSLLDLSLHISPTHVIHPHPYYHCVSSSKLFLLLFILFSLFTVSNHWTQKHWLDCFIQSPFRLHARAHSNK